MGPRAGGDDVESAQTPSGEGVSTNKNGSASRCRFFTLLVVPYAARQWTLTVSSSLLHAFAIAASRLSVSMIGVPSAA